MPISPGTLPCITPATALFLDFDGTLVALASQPELVQVPPTLTATLAALSGQLNGALALVSGRPLFDLDHFLAPLQLPAAAEHGAQRRAPDGRLHSAPWADLHHVIEAAQALVQQHPGLRLERKTLALSLHYRHAPELETLCLQVMREAVERSTGIDLMQGKFVIDLKPAGVSKGTAIAGFMDEAPFAGRLPLFAGDDVTDEAGFEAVQRMGGQAIKVGPGPTLAQHRCAGVAELAAWLQAATTTVTPAVCGNGTERLSA
ncbi:MAG: trehalose 6-phosphatase [Polaromonas sp.]|nr:trehalose 6-phosphatase [Polaromonas sp.]